MAFSLIVSILFSVCMTIAIVVSLVIGLSLPFWFSQIHGGARWRIFLAAMALPPLAVIGLFAGFVGYATWCETVREVDPGIGDTWQVPLGNGYHLCMIGTPERAFVTSPKQQQFSIARIGFDDHVTYFETVRNEFHLITKSTGSRTLFRDQSSLDERLHEIGAQPSSFQSAEIAYQKLRWGLLDLMAFLLILGIPTILIAVVRRYILSVQNTTA